MIEKIVVVTCDGLARTGDDELRPIRCPAKFTGEAAEPVDMVLTRARANGWSTAGGSHYCPSCAKALGKVLR